jgi:rhodanese-related sulfurtransferase
MRPATLLLLFILIALHGCKEKEQSGIVSLRTEAFDAKLKAVSDKIILDVRTPEEFAEGHLDQETLVNFHDEDFTSKVATLDKGKSVFVYCASGVRSAKAATILKEQGFRNIYLMEDGLNDWLELRKSVVR